MEGTISNIWTFVICGKSGLEDLARMGTRFLGVNKLHNVTKFLIVVEEL
jgi:hypothetical protein